MNCLKCEGPTQVIDRRGVRRRRECKACGHRFTTEEVVLGTPPRGPKPKKSRVYVPKVRVRPEPPPPRPKERWFAEACLLEDDPRTRARRSLSPACCASRGEWS